MFYKLFLCSKKVVTIRFLNTLNQLMIRCISTLDYHLLLVVIKKYLPFINGSTLSIAWFNSISASNQPLFSSCHLMLLMSLTLIMRSSIQAEFSKYHESSSGDLELVKLLSSDMIGCLLCAFGHQIDQFVLELSSFLGMLFGGGNSHLSIEDNVH
jgi:hypothetical protein